MKQPNRSSSTMDQGSSTWLITNKPWCTGKQLPLGFSVFGHKFAGANSQANQCIVAGSDPVSVLTTAVESFKK